jgi:hypothetical protein
LDRLERGSVVELHLDGCRHCEERLTVSPVSGLLPEQVSPELLSLQVKLAAQLPYRQAATLLDELLPETGRLNHPTTRNRMLAVGKRIEQEIRKEIDHPGVVPEPAERMVVSRAYAVSQTNIINWSASFRSILFVSPASPAFFQSSAAGQLSGPFGSW